MVGDLLERRHIYAVFIPDPQRIEDEAVEFTQTAGGYVALEGGLRIGREAVEREKDIFLKVKIKRHTDSFSEAVHFFCYAADHITRLAGPLHFPEADIEI